MVEYIEEAMKMWNQEENGKENRLNANERHNIALIWNAD